jgi:hypothetical protein
MAKLELDPDNGLQGTEEVEVFEPHDRLNDMCRHVGPYPMHASRGCLAPSPFSKNTRKL